LQTIIGCFNFQFNKAILKAKCIQVILNNIYGKIFINKLLNSIDIKLYYFDNNLN